MKKRTLSAFETPEVNPQPLPPHNIECEQALLGAILIHNLALGEVTGIVNGGHFFEPLHERVFDVAQKLIQDGKPATPITLKPFFEKEPPIGELPVAAYLGRLAASATTIINARSYAEHIRDCAARREMIVAGEAMIKEAQLAEVPVLDAATRAVDVMTNIIVNPNGKKTSELAYDTAERVIERLYDTTPPDDIVATGLVDLDRLLGGGFVDGDLIVIGGRPSMGKTTFGHAIAMNITRREPTGGVIYYSLEMLKEIMTMRSLSSLVYNRDEPIPYQNIIAKKIPPELLYRFDPAVRKLKTMNLLVDDQPALTMAQVAARSRITQAVWSRKGIRLRAIFADHMLLLRGETGARKEKRHEVGDNYKAAKALAKELMVPFIALHQVKRKEDDTSRPDMDDLGEAGSIEQDADVIMFPWREAYGLRKPFDDPERESVRRETLAEVENDMEVFVAKAKNGPPGSVQLWCSMANNAVRNRTRG